MKDCLGREINYMRISITDRCNLRCRYCMPEGITLMGHNDMLRYEEIFCVCEQAAALGIRKIKITGGEPLVRKGCSDLIAMLKNVPGIEEVTLTTNGVLLEEKLDDLILAGVDAINVSLDTLDRDTFTSITGFDQLEQVRKGIDAALFAGIRLKINTVLQKGVNEQEMFALAELARNQKLDVRFIELMPIGYGESQKGISNQDVLKALRKKYPSIKEDTSSHGNGPAIYYQIPGFQGGIGLISAMHEKFCDSCNRIRMTSRGFVKPCLCYGEGVSLMEALRGESISMIQKTEDFGRQNVDGVGKHFPDTEAVKKLLKKAIGMKPQGHSFEAEQYITENRNMIEIGG